MTLKLLLRNFILGARCERRLFFMTTLPRIDSPGCNCVRSKESEVADKEKGIWRVERLFNISQCQERGGAAFWHVVIRSGGSVGRQAGERCGVTLAAGCFFWVFFATASALFPLFVVLKLFPFSLQLYSLTFKLPVSLRQKPPSSIVTPQKLNLELLSFVWDSFFFFQTLTLRIASAACCPQNNEGSVRSGQIGSIAWLDFFSPPYCKCF